MIDEAAQSGSAKHGMEAVPLLRNARVVFTGRLAAMPRQEAYAIVRKAGGEPGNTVSRHTSLLVVGMEGWPLLPDGRVSNKLRRAEKINQTLRSIRIISELAFLEAVGLEGRKVELQKTYPLEQVCRLLKLSPETLQRWEQFSLIRSEAGMYDFQDIVTLRMIAELVEQEVRPQTIATSIRKLAAVLPGTARPLAQLRIVTENPRSVLAEFGGHRMTPYGQLLLNFETPASFQPRVINLPSRNLSATEWFEHGQILESEENLDDAVKAYCTAVGLRPHFPEAYFNMGNALREMERFGLAEKAFRTCVNQDPGSISGWYNLADVQALRGNTKEAIQSLRQAIQISPTFADAHFNLASCLEKICRRQEARLHWNAYLRLDPNNQWAEIARSKVGSR